jgi:hypothetical protein
MGRLLAGAGLVFAKIEVMPNHQFLDFGVRQNGLGRTIRENPAVVKRENSVGVTQNDFHIVLDEHCCSITFPDSRHDGIHQ